MLGWGADNTRLLLSRRRGLPAHGLLRLGGLLPYRWLLLHRLLLLGNAALYLIIVRRRCGWLHGFVHLGGLICEGAAWRRRPFLGNGYAGLHRCRVQILLQGSLLGCQVLGGEGQRGRLCLYGRR